MTRSTAVILVVLYGAALTYGAIRLADHGVWDGPAGARPSSDTGSAQPRYGDDSSDAERAERYKATGVSDPDLALRALRLYESRATWKVAADELRNEVSRSSYDDSVDPVTIDGRGDDSEGDTPELAPDDCTTKGTQLPRTFEHVIEGSRVVTQSYTLTVHDLRVSQTYDAPFERYASSPVVEAAVEVHNTGTRDLPDASMLLAAIGEYGTVEAVDSWWAPDQLGMIKSGNTGAGVVLFAGTGLDDDLTAPEGAPVSLVSNPLAGESPRWAQPAQRAGDCLNGTASVVAKVGDHPRIVDGRWLG